MSAKGQEVNSKATLEMASPDALNKMRAQKLSWYAVVSILLAAMGGILFGYDMGIIGGCLTLDGFRQDMGWPQALIECGPDRPSEPMYVSVDQSWITSAFMIGCFLASPFAGALSDRMGRWFTVLSGIALFFVGGGLQTAANGVTLMIIGRGFSGLSIGILSSIVPMYIAEISPANMRGSLVTLHQLAITFGILVAFCVNLFVDRVIGTSWSWRIAIGGQCFIALIMGAGMACMPESPRFLALKGNFKKAEEVLLRLRGAEHKDTVQTELLEIQEEVSAQGKGNEDSGSWKEVFSRKLMLNMIVGIVIPSISQLSGINAIMLYSSTIFNDMCLPGLLMTLVVGLVNFCFTFVAVFFSDRAGRKPLLLTGASGMFVSLIVSAIVMWTTDVTSSQASSVAVVCLVLFFIINYASTWGAVASWVVPSEVFPLRVRGKAVGLATAGNWLANVAVAFLTPILIRPDAINVSGTFLLYSVFMGIALPFVLFLFPETKGISLEEMEAKFQRPLKQHIRENVQELRHRKRGNVSERNIPEGLPL